MKILFTVIILNFQYCFSQNTELKDLIKNSFTFNSELKEAQQSVKINENKIEIAKLDLFPTLTGNGNYSYTDQVSQIAGNKIQPNDAFNFNISANYVAFDFGFTKAKISKSYQELQLSNDNADGLKTQLAYQLATLYYNIIYTKNAIAIQNTVIQFLRDNLVDTNNKVKLGDAIHYDELTIQSSLDQELNRKADLENILQKQLNLQKFLSGNDTNNGNDFDFFYTKPAIETMMNAGMKQNSDFIKQNDKIKIAQIDKQIELSENRPTISLKGSTGYKNGFVPGVTDLKFANIIAVNLSIPIYAGGRSKKRNKLSDNLIELQKISLNTLENKFNKDLKDAILDIETSEERLKNIESQVKQATVALALAQIRFKRGVGTNLELTNASTNLQKAELFKNQLQYQLCLAELKIAQIQGIKFWTE